MQVSVSVSVSVSEISIVGEATIQEKLEQKVRKLQRELEILQGGILQYYRRQYAKYQRWYIKLALSGKYTEGQLDRLDDKVEHYKYEIIGLLDMEPYSEEYKSVKIGILADNEKWADCNGSKCHNCAAVCHYNKDPHMRTI